MRTTKNVTVNDRAQNETGKYGFTVSNNYKRVIFTTDIIEARAVASKIAKAENKKIAFNIDGCYHIEEA